MIKVSPYQLRVLATGMLAAAMLTYSFLHWQAASQNNKNLHRIARQLDSSLDQSQSMDLRQQQRLQLLNRTHAMALSDRFEPEQWLSDMQAIVAGKADVSGFSARVLVAELSVLSERAQQQIIAVPIEFELMAVDPVLAAELINRLGLSIGVYSRVNLCRLQRRTPSAENTRFRVQCRFEKTAVRGTPL